MYSSRRTSTNGWAQLLVNGFSLTSRSAVQEFFLRMLASAGQTCALLSGFVCVFHPMPAVLCRWQQISNFREMGCDYSMAAACEAEQP